MISPRFRLYSLRPSDEGNERVAGEELKSPGLHPACRASLSRALHSTSLEASLSSPKVQAAVMK